MIFVTVGTHEQPFNRLLEEIDKLIGEGIIKEEVFAQIGYSTYTPKHYKYSKFLDYDAMQDYFKRSNIVITHGGPSSFMEAIKVKKTPIVVPRQEKFNEHVNNHQLDFCKELVKRDFPIICVEDIKELGHIINNSLINKAEDKFNFNNESFCKELSNIILSICEM